jgi:hypothetical protein
MFSKIFVVNYFMIRNLTIVFIFTSLILLNACNTITGTVEGTGNGIIKDVKTMYHYSTCIFTDTQCGDLNLK